MMTLNKKTIPQDEQIAAEKAFQVCKSMECVINRIKTEGFITKNDCGDVILHPFYGEIDRLTNELRDIARSTPALIPLLSPLYLPFEGIEDEGTLSLKGIV